MQTHPEKRVLIETLWNVKGKKEVDMDANAIVLIETLWNVKIVITWQMSCSYQF